MIDVLCTTGEHGLNPRALYSVKSSLEQGHWSVIPEKSTTEFSGKMDSEPKSKLPKLEDNAGIFYFELCKNSTL